ncbi:NADH-quinone oxidoreductase subunit C [Catenulispora sp. MAP12-49]|jgi:NADH-quinone oxidoreductase subunit C|uniref:NADH-quinone oxidoreductase subunit C n=1 Tax=unclassified Catenulispora TaxID=414885 RepID=UPI00351930EF
MTEAETWDDVQETFGERTVTAAPGDWLATLERAHGLGYTFFDWLTAVDEEDAGFDVFAHVAKVEGDERAARLLIRTRIPKDKAELPSAVHVYRGANWHERETFEMFGITFTNHPNLIPLLLPDGFDGHPLRKDFVLAARVAKEWPGVKEPGEGGPSHAAPAGRATRRRMVPPGVPDGWLKPLPEDEPHGSGAADAADTSPAEGQEGGA